MEDNKISVENLLERAEDFGKTSLELIKLKVIERMSEMFASLMSGMIIIAPIFIFFGLFNIGMALWLGNVLGKPYEGFFCVAAFYAFLGILLFFFFRKWIQSATGNFFVKKVFENTKWEK